MIQNNKKVPIKNKRIHAYLEEVVILGNTYRKEGQVDNAKRNYCLALEIDQYYKNAWLNLGALLANENLYDEEVHNAMMQGDPYGTYHVTFSAMSMDEDMAIEDIMQPTQEDFGLDKAFAYGERLLMNSQFQAANDFFSTLAMKYPSFLAGWMNLSVSKAKLNYLLEAKEIILEKIFKKDPTYPSAHHNLSIIYREEKNFPLWVKHQLIEIKNSNYNEQKHKETLTKENIEKLLNQGQYMLVINYLVRYQQVYQKDSWSYQLLSEAYYKLGKLENSIRTMVKASNIDPGNIEVQKKIRKMENNFMIIYESSNRAGNFKKAQRALELALLVNSNNRTALFHLGMLQQQTGSIEQSQATFQKYKNIA